MIRKYKDSERKTWVSDNGTGGGSSGLVAALSDSERAAILPEDPPPTQAVIDALWHQADAIALSACDRNARERFTVWLMSPDTPADGRNAIMAVLAWMDDVWRAYTVAKQAVLDGKTYVTLGTIPPCPFDFWAVANLCEVKR